MSVTADEVKAASAGERRAVHLRDCSICGYPITYIVYHDELFVDSGCWCMKGPPTITQLDWQKAADLINMQTNLEHRNRFREGFGLPAEGPA